MAIFDRFRKKKKVKGKEPKKEIKEKEKLSKESPVSKSKTKKRTSKKSEAHRILRKPHITEKANELSEKKQYVFEIFPNANKPEIKKAIESLFGVDVISVRIVRIPRKRRRRGRVSGWKKGYKKAIVRIREGQKIEVLPK